MKRFLQVAFVLVFSFILVACETTSEYCFGDCGYSTEEDYLGSVHDVLENEGFPMNESVVETELEALANHVNTTYSINITPFKLQYGGMTDAQTSTLYYADVVQVSTSTQALQYYDELVADTSVTCFLFVYHNVVVKTDSQAAYDALDAALT